MASSTRRYAEYAIRPSIVQIVAVSAVMLAATVHDPAAQRPISPVTDASNTLFVFAAGTVV